MKQENTFENTNVSLTPSFLGNGWEVCLSPKLRELQELNHFDFVITFSRIKDMFLKMLPGRGNGHVWIDSSVIQRGSIGCSEGTTQ